MMTHMKVIMTVRFTQGAVRQVIKLDENTKRGAVKRQTVKSLIIPVVKRKDEANINIENTVGAHLQREDLNIEVNIVDHEVKHQANLGATNLKDTQELIVDHLGLVNGSVRRK